MKYGNKGWTMRYWVIIENEVKRKLGKILVIKVKKLYIVFQSLTIMIA